MEDVLTLQMNNNKKRRRNHSLTSPCCQQYLSYVLCQVLPHYVPARSTDLHVAETLTFALPIFLQTHFHHVLVQACGAARSPPVPAHQGSKAQAIFQHGKAQGDTVGKEKGNREDSATEPVLFALLFH